MPLLKSSGSYRYHVPAVHLDYISTIFIHVFVAAPFNQMEILQHVHHFIHLYIQPDVFAFHEFVISESKLDYIISYISY